MNTPAVTSAVLANIAVALGIRGGAAGVIRVFAPPEARELLPADAAGDADALAFLRNVDERASALAMLAQAAENTSSVPIAACMQDLTEVAGLKRELVRLERRAAVGLQVTTLPIVGGKWWTDQASLIEAADEEAFFAPPPPARPKITVRPLPKVPLPKPSAVVRVYDDDDEDDLAPRRRPAAKRTQK